MDFVTGRCVGSYQCPIPWLPGLGWSTYEYFYTANVNGLESTKSWKSRSIHHWAYLHLAGFDQASGDIMLDAE